MEVKKNSEVSLVLTDDKEIQHLNRVYRNNDYPTDVLSFSMQEGLDDFAGKDELGEYLLGDIIISIETANRQAKDSNHSLYNELAILLVHGLLHLLGFEHIDEVSTQKMQREEKRILKFIQDDYNLKL